jgi:phage tail-like protein
MAVTKDQIRESFPLPVYNYRVEINDATIGFSQVSGLSIGYETHTYKESPIAEGVAGPRVMHMPAQSKAVTVTLKKGIVGLNNIAIFFDWISSIQTNQVEKKDVYIRLCNEVGEAVISWQVVNAFPTKLDAPGFDANSNDAAIETLELMADRILMSAS